MENDNLLGLGWFGLFLFPTDHRQSENPRTKGHDYGKTLPLSVGAQIRPAKYGGLNTKRDLINMMLHMVDSLIYFGQKSWAQIFPLPWKVDSSEPASCEAFQRTLGSSQLSGIQALEELLPEGDLFWSVEQMRFESLTHFCGGLVFHKNLGSFLDCPLRYGGEYNNQEGDGRAV